MIELHSFYKEDKNEPDREFYFEPEAIKTVELSECKKDNKTIYYLTINNEYIFAYELQMRARLELQKILNAKEKKQNDK